MFNQKKPICRNPDTHTHTHIDTRTHKQRLRNKKKTQLNSIPTIKIQEKKSLQTKAYAIAKNKSNCSFATLPSPEQEK